jgi:site-specific recombinase XerD
MVTLNDLKSRYQDYLQYERGLAKQTVKSYLNDIDRLIAFVGNSHVEDITLDQLRAHMRDMAYNGLSANTIRRRIHSLNTLYAWLELEHIVKEQLPKRLRLPKRKEQVPVWLTADELHRFVTTPSRLQIAWQLLAWFGLRRAEVLSITWNDIQWEQSLLVVQGKGDVVRFIPIPVPVWEILWVKWIELEKPEGRIVPIGKSPFVRAFQRHVKNCGLDPQKVTPHVLRHTFATTLSAQGTDITIIRALLGHKDIKTTLVYVHTNRERLESAMDVYTQNL